MHENAAGILFAVAGWLVFVAFLIFMSLACGIAASWLYERFKEWWQ